MSRVVAVEGGALAGATSVQFGTMHGAEAFDRGLGAFALIEVQVREELYGSQHQPMVIGKKDEKVIKSNVALYEAGAAWAESNPRTLFLLQEETATWARNGPLRLLLALGKCAGLASKRARA